MKIYRAYLYGSPCMHHHRTRGGAKACAGFWIRLGYPKEDIEVRREGHP